MTESKRPRGRPAKLGEYQPFALRLPIEVHKELSDKARELGVSLNDLIVQICSLWLQENKNPNT